VLHTYMLEFLQISDVFRLMASVKELLDGCRAILSQDGALICYPSKEKCSWMPQLRINDLSCQRHDLIWDGSAFRSKAMIACGNTIQVLSNSEGSKFQEFRYYPDYVQSDDGYTTGYYYSYHDSEACAIMFHGTSSEHYNRNNSSLHSCIKVRVRMSDDRELFVVPSPHSIQRDELFNVVVAKDMQLFRLEGMSDSTKFMCVTRKHVDKLKQKGYLKNWIKFFSWISVHETLLSDRLGVKADCDL